MFHKPGRQDGGRCDGRRRPWWSARARAAAAAGEGDDSGPRWSASSSSAVEGAGIVCGEKTTLSVWGRGGRHQRGGGDAEVQGSRGSDGEEKGGFIFSFFVPEEEKRGLASYLYVALNRSLR